MNLRVKQSVLIPIAYSAFSLFSVSPSMAAENFYSWANSTHLILNTSVSGVNMAATVTGFPMLVRLNSSNFPFTQAQAAGQDIRFAKNNGIPLHYEIERWDPVLQQAEIWIKVDTVYGNNATQSIRMLWGNPTAVDSSDPGAVFGPTNGFVGVWHLSGSGTQSRPNSVAGGQPAVPMGYEGDESTSGVIAGADNLDGSGFGDYLDLGDGYADFSGGLTFTVWVYPTAVKKWSHILDLGNGQGIDNLVLSREDTTSSLGFHNWNGTAPANKHAPNQWVLNQWQQFGVTVTGKYFKLYKNGVVVLADSLNHGPSIAYRTLNFLGKSNWANDHYYQGKLDEPELSRTAHSEAWMKLVYQNQKPDQTFPTVANPPACPPKLMVSQDMSVPGGGQIALTAIAECATGFAWQVVSGPTIRILDPEAKSLVVTAPRIQADTTVVFRMTATFSSAILTQEVRVRLYVSPLGIEDRKRDAENSLTRKKKAAWMDAQGRATIGKDADSPQPRFRSQ